MSAPVPYRHPLAVALDSRRGPDGSLDPSAFLACLGVGPNAVHLNDLRQMASEGAWERQMTAPPPPAVLNTAVTPEDSAARMMADAKAHVPPATPGLAALEHFLRTGERQLPAAAAPEAAPTHTPPPAPGTDQAVQDRPLTLAQAIGLKMHTE